MTRSFLRTVARCVTVSLALALAAPAARGTDGYYDPSFAPPNGRRLLTELPRSRQSPVQIALDTQSRIVLAAGCNAPDGPRECVFRLTPAGALDLFGASLNGRWLGPNADYAITSLRILTDDRIVFGSQRLAQDGALAVIQADGSGLDAAAFGGLGRVVLANEPVRAIARQSDGRFVVGIEAFSSTVDFRVRRFSLTSPTPDATFSGGVRNIGFDLGGTNVDAVRQLVVLPDDRILVAGIVETSAGLSAGVLRLLPDGQLDTSFGTSSGRTVITYQGSRVEQAFIAVDAAGRIVVLMTLHASPNRGMYAARLLPDGTFDPLWQDCATSAEVDWWNFRNNGELLSAGIASQVVAQADGKVLVLGRAEFSTGIFFAIARLTHKGCLDTSFGASGRGLGNFAPGSTGSNHPTMVIGNGGLMLAGLTMDGLFPPYGIAKVELATPLPPPELLRDGFESP